MQRRDSSSRIPIASRTKRQLTQLPQRQQISVAFPLFLDKDRLRPFARERETPRVEYIWFVVDCVYTRRLIRLIVADLGVHSPSFVEDEARPRTRAVEASAVGARWSPLPECRILKTTVEKRRRPGL